VSVDATDENSTATMRYVSPLKIRAGMGGLTSSSCNNVSGDGMCDSFKNYGIRHSNIQSKLAELN